MDPNKVLQDLVTKARAAIALSDQEDTLSMADDVLALHDWLSKGGFLPAAWTPDRPCGMSVTVSGGPRDGLTYNCLKAYNHPGDC